MKRTLFISSVLPTLSFPCHSQQQAQLGRYSLDRLLQGVVLGPRNFKRFAFIDRMACTNQWRRSTSRIGLYLLVLVLLCSTWPRCAAVVQLDPCYPVTCFIFLYFDLSMEGCKSCRLSSKRGMVGPCISDIVRTGVPV